MHAVVAAATPLAASVHATDKQTEYAACPINHSPEFYCCEINPDTKIVYTKYNRPKGGDYESYYEEGWNLARQINLPDAKYKPDSPEFHYNDPSKTCRVLAVVQDGKLVETLQCTFDAAGATTNTSWTEESKNTSVFWTSAPNPRNNNATFPIGAKCTSLMLPNGKVDVDAKKNCKSGGFPMTFKINTFTEAPIVALYAVYGVCFALLALWTAFRVATARSDALKDDAAAMEDGSKKLLDNRGGPQTPGKSSIHRPSLAMRPTEVQLRHSVEDIIQIGYSDSAFGMVSFVYFGLMTVLLNALVIVVVLDNTWKFKEKLFDPNEVIIKVFIGLWVVTCVWFGLVVSYQERLQNFFRVPDSLDRCTRVHLFKPEKTEVLLADRSGVSQFVLRVEKVLFPNAQQGVEETVRVHSTASGDRYLEFQHLRYTFDDVEGRFIPASVVLGNTFDQILADSNGLSNEEHTRRLDMVGRNAIEVEMPTIYKSLVDEFFSFFYIYQLMCYYVWYFTDYTYVAALNTVVILSAAIVNIFTKRQMLASIVKMTHYQCDVTVQRDGQWVTIKSSDVVPGDLVRVAENWELPCDMVIVKGSTVCDESMLTGESMPVQKFPIPHDSRATYSADGAGKKYTLFSGTKTLASGRNEEILAIVQSTGAHTSRGQLVQAILFPAPMRFKYDEHLKAMVSFLFLWAILAAYLAMKFLIDNAGLSNTLFAFVYGTFMFSAVLNPLLPVVITIGQVNAAKRLQKQEVFCLNPQRVTLSGKVRVFCFDKTGTITKEGLDYRGCVPVRAGAMPTFESECMDMTSADLNSTMKFALASCHAVGSLNGDLVGNEVEVKMFRSTQWKLIELEGQQPFVQSPDGSDELVVVKRFEFDHHRMSMSVVMQHKATGKLYVFCKGSYEKMQAISSPASVPLDYQNVAESLAKNGCYVLGMAFKEVTGTAGDDLQRFLADRDAVEENVALLGLIMFRNEIKPDSRDAILTLKRGDIRTVMITGDNAMTGCYIARESGMVDDDAQVILGDMVLDEASGTTLAWKDVDSETTFTTDDVRNLAATSNNLEMAVTGKAFDYLVKVGEIKDLLLNIRIFSRMTPNGKVECVRLHMAAGAVTGMCGDGGNDCGALRIAHVGVALSEAEASVVSPFTSKTRSLVSVVDLVLEGRGALATSFGSVKFLIMYGLVGLGLRFVMYYNSVFVSQFCFMFSDGAIVVGLAYAVTRSRPLRTMGTQRPTSSLVGPTTVCSLTGQTLIHVIFLYFGIHYVMTRPWYCPFTPDNVDLVKWWLLQDSNLSTCLWVLISFQQMASGITCSLGSKFRLPVWRNYFLLFYYTLLIVFVAILVLGPPSRLTDQFRIASSTNVIGLPDIPLPSSFRWELFGIGVANTIVVVMYEHLVVLGPVRTYLRNKYHKDILPMKL
ncbi:TPA: hypothetical protein N0F65_000650 [Lagenidium giganteum]|uniref:Ig-like domain-containing protein n=1 Tax=Lagenidium giganteum TaxID=4803 RepID=A0AAV2YSB2_9STRA|nr:TPA: hypothetical protein N0F65_000650 [Lagenidium giganteum]